jgi:hypothetical protein
MELRPKHVSIRNLGCNELLPRILDFLTFEEGTDRLSLNVRKESPLYAP